MSSCRGTLGCSSLPEALLGTVLKCLVFCALGTRSDRASVEATRQGAVTCLGDAQKAVPGTERGRGPSQLLLLPWEHGDSRSVAWVTKPAHEEFKNPEKTRITNCISSNVLSRSNQPTSHRFPMRMLTAMPLRKKLYSEGPK